MNADLENLIVLQAQDLDLTRLRQQVAAGPQQIAASETALRSAEKLLTETRSALAAEEKLRRSQESEIGTLRTKVDRLRRSLDAATSAAQVTAFENELTFARSAIGRLEEDEYASLERSESLGVQLSRAGEQVAQKEAQLGADRVRVAQGTAQDKETIAGVEQQRRELRMEINPDRLAQYDRLAKAKGTAVAEAIGNTGAGRCAACQMAVRPQRWQDLTGRDHLDDIFTCETCGRMLFWDPRRDTPRAWEIGDRLRRAQAGSSAGGRP